MMQFPEDIPDPVLRKKKASTARHSLHQPAGKHMQGAQAVPRTAPLKMGKKAFKRSLLNEVPTLNPQPERSNSDSLPESSLGNEYRTLRRKYLLMEEEGFRLGSELQEVEEEVKRLEDEKLALLDQLVVLEGLIEPSELHYH